MQLLLKTALTVRNGARWAIALALGLRQGEALGLRWSDVDLDTGSLMVRRARLRPRWSHGCGGTCGRKHGGQCPLRVAERSETSETKSRAGRRAVGLPGQLVSLLREHRVAQERLVAAQLWTDGDWVFATPTGAPINPRTDYTEWKRLLWAPGVRGARLHDNRHTAAAVLLILGVAEQAVVGIMGWSHSETAACYQHVTSHIQRDIASQVDRLIWDPK